MNYDSVIDLHNVTIGECISLYSNSKLCVLINNGDITNFVNMEEE